MRKIKPPDVRLSASSQNSSAGQRMSAYQADGIGLREAVHYLLLLMVLLYLLLQ
jgi:hypothetical protein